MRQGQFGIVDRAGRTLGGLALSLGVVGATALVCHTVVRVKADPRDYSVEVTGSARRTVLADRVSWSAALAVRVATVSDGHLALERARERMTAYLVGRGLPGDSFRFSAAEVQAIQERASEHAPLRTVGHLLTQTLTVETDSAEPLRTVAGESAELIAAAEIAGGEFEWRPGNVQFGYSRLDELKQDVLAEATRNGRMRAQAIAAAAGQRLGALRLAELGDVQEIRSPGSTSRYSDSDSSPVKDIIADVKVLYHLR